MAVPSSAPTIPTDNYQQRLKARLLRYQGRLFAQAFSLGKLKSKETAFIFAAEITHQLRKSSEQKLQLINDLASSIIAQKLSDDPQIIIFMCDRLLSTLDASEVKLYLHPTDAGMVRAALAKEWPKITVLEDSSFTRGSIKIKTTKFCLDASVPTQINKAIDLLALEMNKHGHLDPI